MIYVESQQQSKFTNEMSMEKIMQVQYNTICKQISIALTIRYSIISKFQQMLISRLINGVLEN